MGLFLLSEMEKVLNHRHLFPIWEAIADSENDTRLGEEERFRNRRIICEAIAERQFWSPDCSSIGFRFDDGRRRNVHYQYRSLTLEEEEADQIALGVAIVVRNIYRVRAVLSKNPDVNIENLYFGRPLQLAAKLGSVEIVQLLLTAGADIHASQSIPWREAGWLNWPHGLYNSSCGRALEVACLAGREDIVQLFFQQPRFAEDLSEEEYTLALENAVRGGHRRLISFSLEKLYDGHIAHPTDIPRRIFILAAYNGHEKIVDMMLQAGVDVNSLSTIHGCPSALQLASVRGHANVTRLLLERGADRDFIGDFKHLDALTCGATRGYVEVVQVLLDYGADINQRMKGRYLLDRVRVRGQSHMLSFLLQKGADLDLPLVDYEISLGEHLLLRAVRRRELAIVRVLVQAGVPPNNMNQLIDPVLNAMAYGQKRILQELLALGGKEFDPMENCWAEDFKCGTYPLKERDYRMRSPRKGADYWRGRY